MKHFKLLVTFILFTTLGFSQGIMGTWNGKINVQGTDLPLIFKIDKTETGYKSTLTSPLQSPIALPSTMTSFLDSKLIVQIVNLNIEYKGEFKGTEISGIFTQRGLNFPLILTKDAAAPLYGSRPQEPKPPYNYLIKEVSFTNPVDKNTLAGTLTTPKDKTEFPVVVMITGSGSQNRDEEVFGHKPFWVIADDFANKGIGVLRLDDRGVGKSTMGSKEDNTENFASDINTAVHYLNDNGFNNIGLIGHSEGGLIAPIVAAENKNVKFIISMAGPGIAIDKLMLLQTKAVSKSNGIENEETDTSANFNKTVYAFVKNYSGSNLKSDLRLRLIAEMKKLPEEQLGTADQMNEFVESQLQQLTMPWFVNFIKYEPNAYWSRITIPVLAINGTKDVQVTATENLNGIATSLNKAANEHFVIRKFDNLNHLFQKAETGALSEYAKIEQTISPEVLNTMSNWILEKK